MASKKVLFLSLSGIGNLLMQLPTIKLLKQAHPDWHITVWVAPRGTAELARSQSYIDQVIEMPIRANIFQHIKNLMKLRMGWFDYAIILSPGQLVKSALYCMLAGIPKRIGNSYPLKNNPESSFGLTDSVEEKMKMHDIEQNIRLLEPLGIHIHDQERYELEIPVKNKQEAEKMASSQSYIGIHAGSAKGFEFKQWPIERFADVAQQLLKEEPSTLFLIFGGPSEDFQKQELVDLINTVQPNSAQLIHASLMTTAALMQYCRFVLANDSGLMHLSAAAGVPTIGLFGPTDEHLTGPRGVKSITIRANGTKPVYSTEHTPFLGTTTHESLLALTPTQVIDNIHTFVP